MSFYERRVTTFDNLSLYVRDFGDSLDPRPPILCLGGLTRNSKDFESLAGRYSRDGRRIICPDYRGRGRSQYDPNWSNYNPQIYIRDIKDLLSALNLHRVVVIGTSLGGILGMGMGTAMPTVLTAIVMNDIGPVVEDKGLDFIIEYIKEDRPHKDWDSAVITIKKMLPNLRFQDEHIWLKMAKNTFHCSENGELRFDWDVNIVKPQLKANDKIPNMWPLFRALTGIPTMVLRGT